jgi:pullulanase
MRIFFFFSLFCMMLFADCSTSKSGVQPGRYNEYPAYEGTDLGMTYSKKSTTFKLWSPPAQEARLLLYDAGQGGTATKTIDLKKEKAGIWSTSLKGNQAGKYYTVQVKTDGKWLAETPDPYAKATGINGQRGMIVDMAATNPANWDKDRRPALASYNDIILYELHVRDLSSHPSSNIRQTGKFLGLTEAGTRNADGLSTGLDHIKDLGVTHVHLLPVFDYRSVDESAPEGTQYNWGYDPENYNVPEGSYATNAADGSVRIREFKQLVQTLHANGLRVIMDVVYNHTGATNESVFNRCVPGYYYRQNAAGGWSDASACGNETASERPMMRKYMIESMEYWAREYHIDGFRVDLMGIHDIETMNQLSTRLRTIDPTIFVYGEGWTAGGSPLPDAQRALKANTWKLDKIAAFGDDFRDGLKGSVFDHHDKGFISGKPGMEESIKFGVAGAVQHPQINYEKVNYSKAPWAGEPYQAITYVDCHDNHTLWDRLTISCPDASEKDRVRMHRLAGAMVLTSQGVPFLHAGVEMLRTKQGVENSYKSPDLINHLDWKRKTQYRPEFDYFKALVRLRKGHPAFRLTSSDLIRKHLQFLDVSGSNIVAYQLKDNAGGDAWKNIVVIFNGNNAARTVTLPAGDWKMVLDEQQLDERGLKTIKIGRVEVPAISAMVLMQN